MIFIRYGAKRSEHKKPVIRAFTASPWETAVEDFRKEPS
jgi:hypothetical protein